MIRTIDTLHMIIYDYLFKFESLIILKSQDICKKCSSIVVYFWNYVGTTIMTLTIDPLRNIENNYGSKFQALIHYSSQKINEKSWTIGFLNIYFKRAFVLPNGLLWKHLFQTAPFEIDLYDIDLFLHIRFANKSIFFLFWWNVSLWPGQACP